jgi:hypothetical protein
MFQLIELKLVQSSSYNVNIWSSLAGRRQNRYGNVVRNTIADSNFSNIVAKLVKYVDLKYSDMYVVDLFANLGNKQTNYYGM